MIKSFLAVITAVIFVFSSFNASAQDSTSSKRIREYWLMIGGINPLSVSFKYKHQFSKKLFLKVGVIDASYSKTSLEPVNPGTANITEQTVYSGGVEAGLEFRKNISKAFTFFHGLNASLGYEKYKYEINTAPTPRESTTTTYVVGSSYTLGLLFHIKGPFYVGAEINPSYTYTKRVSATNTSAGGSIYYGHQVGFDSGRGVVSFVFRR